MTDRSQEIPEEEAFLKLARARMPFGRYQGWRLIDLPESYVVWFSQKGYPQGSLGVMLKSLYEIKLNGLEYLFEEFKNNNRA